MKLSRFTDEGIAQFVQYLVLLSADPRAEPPLHLLDDPLTSASVAGEIELDASSFRSRLEAGQYLNSILATVPNPEEDKRMWAWLSLFFFDSVCPKVNGSRKPGQLYRHVPEVGNYRRYYRHLLLGPYLVYRFYSKNPATALSLLCQPLDRPGDVVGQIVAYQELITNEAVVETATRLYYDASKQREKRGAQNKSRGGARALVAVLNQFDVTWDLYGMTAEEISAMLPKEFARFQNR
ncbi:MAG TPA: hypothetical protein VG936_12490 [Lacunisphaera sp.]|nr:hypothetical protein [Lacunisphaera sp.]